MIGTQARPSRGWPRAAGLFGVVLATGVLRPGVLVAVPLLIFLTFDGLRSVRVAVAAALAMFIVATGPRDGLWFAERAWSVLIGGGFLALTMVGPSWKLSTRALGAVLGAVAVAAAVVTFRSEAWIALDVAISDAVRTGFDTSIYVMSTLSEDGLSPNFEAGIVQIAEAQVSVYPALLCLGSMAALGVAWWARARLVGEGDQAIGPLRSFRFNDHLVWLLVAGMLLLVVQWGGSLARLGSNTVVFMGALYALRGAAVFLFVSGGLSLFGYVTFFIGLVLAAPVLIGVAMLIGIGDTWLDIRSRASEGTA
ncbi:MAG TPA: DUF2232 domain-containing protein [Longimicrobiales bacterium]|nr:DUF2232 domain-containing protein [Longimicrobiales bacterium]